jgi:hypothetical protein
MWKGIEDLDARAMKKEMEKGYGKKMDKDKDHKERRQRDEGDAMWEQQPHTKPPLPSPACQVPCPTRKQQTGTGQGCRILATAYGGQGGGQLKVLLMIQRIPYVTGRCVQYYGTPELRYH